MKNMCTFKQDKGVWIAIGLSVLWIVIAVIVSILGYFEYQRDAFHLMIIVTVATPTLLFALLFAISPNFRIWTQNLNVAMLTLPHAWRTIGFLFLVQWYYGILPAEMAAPAGFGDFIAGIVAPFVAVAIWLKWKNATSFAVGFHIFGAIDLVLAIVTGTSAFGLTGEELKLIDPLTSFPTVIIPTAFVPLLLMSHVMVFTKVYMDKKDSGINNYE